jgi:hypothetical protein
MPSIFTLEGARDVAGLAAEVSPPAPGFFHRQGIVVGGILAFTLALAVGGALAAGVIYGGRKVGIVRR